jgi:hypothetical protein
MKDAVIFWRVASIVCLGSAIIQGYLVGDRIRHLTTIVWKIGGGPGLISAGREMILLFFPATVAFLTLGFIATDRLRYQASSFRFLSMLGTQILIAGALIWGAMLASPYVQIVAR